MTYNSGGSSTITAPVRGIGLSGERNTKKGNFIPPHMVIGGSGVGLFHLAVSASRGPPYSNEPRLQTVVFCAEVFLSYCVIL